MLTICEGLLQEPMVEEAIRVGDCLAMMVEFYHGRGKMRDAFSCLKEFEHRRLPPEPYLNRGMLESIYKAVGERPGAGALQRDSGPGTSNAASAQSNATSSHSNSHHGNRGGDDDIDEELEEDIDEEVEDAPSPQYIRGNRHK
jgi:hypothetical protein